MPTWCRSDQHQVKQRSFVKKIYGQEIDDTHVSAIQLSTAAGLVAILEVYAGGSLQPGFVQQEDIFLEAFFATRWEGRVYDPGSHPSSP